MRVPLAVLRLLALPFLVLAALTVPAAAATYNITSAAGFSSLPSTLQAGDEVILAPGTYNNVNRTITAAGTRDKPVILRASNPGETIFSGNTQFQIRGTYLIISGLVFDGDRASGRPASSSGVFRFTTTSSDCTIRDCYFNNFNGGSTSSTFWILVNGYRNTIEYCSFIGKTTENPVINIVPQEDDQAPSGTYPTRDVPRHHLIRYCYFGERTAIGDNGYETIRIGVSQSQMYNMATTVEYCVFERAIYGADVTGYEPEVISSKSRNNIYRYNTFRHNKGGLVLRHGDDNIVEGNFFFGEPGSIMGAGVRIIGMRHIIRNNYFQDIGGTGMRAAICLMKGSGEYSENSTDNGYETPSFARIHHNTFVDCASPFALGVTSSSGGTVPPREVEIRNNVVQSKAGMGDVINFNSANGWAISQIAFSGNYAYHATGTYGTIRPASGFTTGTPTLLVQDPTLGYAIPQAASPARGAATPTNPPTLLDLRGLPRPATGADSGAYESQASGTPLNRPMVKADVGPSYAGRTNPVNAPTLLIHPEPVSVIEGSSATLSVSAQGTGPLSYEWRHNGTPIPGTSAPELVLDSVSEEDAGSYSVIVSNAGGHAISHEATLTVRSRVPVILTQPRSVTANFGTQVTFSVVAEGGTPLSYEWRHKGVPIPGASGTDFTFTPTQASQAGSYTVVVSNAYGSVESNPATLTLPAEGETFLVIETFSDGNYTGQNPPSSLAWYGSSTSALSVANGEFTINTGGTSGRHAVAGFPAQTLALGESLTLRFDFVLGGTLLDQSNGLRFGLFNTNGSTTLFGNNANGNVSYRGYAVTTNINPSAPSPLILRERAATSNPLITAVTSYSALGSAGGPIASFVAGTSYSASFKIHRTGEDEATITATFTGGDLPEYTVSRTDSADIVTSFDLIAIAIASSSSIAAAGSITLDNITLIRAESGIPTPPHIESPLSPVTVTVGQPVGFSVTATGTKPISYQWYHNDAPIEGASSATLSILAAQSGDAGNYHVVVSNDFGTDTSNTATLTVLQPVAPGITTHPTGGTVSVGGSITFTVAATGSTPLFYQWLHNDAEIPGADQPSLSLVNIQPSDAGVYRVRVSNAGGSILSNPATLTVDTTSSAPQVLFHETFADGNPNVQDPANGSLAWFSSSSSSTLTVANSAMTVTAGSSSRHIVGYFPPQTLGVGDRLELAFDFSLTAPLNNVSGGLRVALLDSYAAEPRVVFTSDNSNPSTITYRGYAAMTNPAPTAADPVTIRERPATAATLITGGNYVTLGSGGSSAGFEAGTPYHANFVIERTGESVVTISITYTGGTLSGHSLTITDTDDVVTAFDTIAFGISTSGGAAVNALTVGNIALIRVNAPPASTPRNAWRLAAFGTTANSGDAADSADPDRDGIPNFLEYALGLNPLAADTGSPRPAGSTVNVNGTDYLALSFTRNPGATDIVFTVQASSDMQEWFDIDPFGPNQVSATTDGDRETIVVRDTVPLPADARRFLRLFVSPSP